MNIIYQISIMFTDTINIITITAPIKIAVAFFKDPKSYLVHIPLNLWVISRQ